MKIQLFADRLYCSMALFSVFLFITGCDAKSTAKHQIDWTGAEQLVFRGGYANKIDEARVYVTASRSGFDSKTTVGKIVQNAPAYQTTNAAAIANLVARLQTKADIAGVDKPSKGRTCHILLFTKQGSEIVHFRVFLPNDPQGTALWVYPRSDTKFLYVNPEILSWLESVGISRERSQLNPSP